MAVKKIKRVYEQTWQVHGYTMLSMDLGVTMPFRTIKRQLCSFTDKNWLFTYEKNIGSMYYSQQEMERAGYWGKKDFLDNRWFKKYIKNCRKLYTEAEKIYRANHAEKLKKLDRESLFQITNKIGWLLINIYGYFNTCQPQCVVQLEKNLEKEISIKSVAEQGGKFRQPLEAAHFELKDGKTVAKYRDQEAEQEKTLAEIIKGLEAASIERRQAWGS